MSYFPTPILFRIATAAVLALALNADGGLATRTGSEPRLWDAGQFCVIVAHVVEVRAVDPSEHTGTHRAVLEPLVTLAGRFDPTAENRIGVRIEQSDVTSSVHRLPAQDAIVLAVINPGIYRSTGKTGFWVVSDVCALMPGGSALVTVGGLGDPKILATAAKIREARAHPE